MTGLRQAQDERESVQGELGPVLPSRIDVHHQAVELSALARLAVEFTVAGRGVDVPRALRQFERMRAILGLGPGEGGD